MRSLATTRIRTLAAVLMTSLLGLGCSTTQTLSLVSTKNVDLSATYNVAARGQEASEGRFWLLFIPFAGEPNALSATTKLLDKHNGDYLTNVAVKKTGWSLLVFSWGSVTIKGDVYSRVNTPAATPAAAPTPAEPATEPATEPAETAEPAAETPAAETPAPEEPSTEAP
jgi:hypothetical protein